MSSHLPATNLAISQRRRGLGTVGDPSLLQTHQRSKSFNSLREHGGPNGLIWNRVCDSLHQPGCRVRLCIGQDCLFAER